MNSLWVVLIGGVIIYLAYNLYAKRIDAAVIQPDPEKQTPARMYMDGADFMPTSRFVLYGYHFKSIAAAGPIVGVITAAALWGWLPSIIWLMVGVSFIGWASDYSAIMLAVRNDGNSLSAVAHRLIAPRVRTILFVFIFFYLLLIGGAFVGIMAAILDARPDVPFGILVLAIMGLVAGQLIYRRRANLMGVTLLVVVVTLVAMMLGPLGVDFPAGKPPTWDNGAVSGTVNSVKEGVNGDSSLYGVEDPTGADPRITRDPETQKPVDSPTFNLKTGQVQVFPSFIFWGIFLLVFSYLGANLPADSLVGMVREESPDLVVLSVTMAFHLDAARETVRRLRDAGGDRLRVSLGGQAFAWAAGCPRTDSPASAARSGPRPAPPSRFS